MKNSFEASDHGDLKREVDALRRRIEDLECGQARPRRPAVPLVTAIAIVLLTLGVLGAQSGGVNALFIDHNGNVGVGKSDPKATLDVAGTVNVSGSSRLNGAVGINTDPIPSQNLVIIPTKGNIPFNVTDPANKTNWLSVFPDGKVVMNGGNVGIGTVSPGAKLDVVGDARIQGKFSSRSRYQRDDLPEGTYELPPRYHLSLTAPAYAGRTKTIPQDTLVALCGKPDGCEVRLGMTRWENDSPTETASVLFLFYYSAQNGRWRSRQTDGSAETWGVDGNGRTEHVKSAWDTCFFTDGNYSGYKDQGDSGKGMQLLVWNNYKGVNRTCELTIVP